MTPALVVPVLGRSLYPGASVALDFTRNLYRSGTPVVKTSPALLSGWTFSRASTGYAETAAGALVGFASGAPRTTDKGLLVEEARTNLLLRSQEFDNASWGKTNVMATANAAIAPDGTLTADKVEATTSAVTTMNQDVALAATAGATSIFGKKGSGATDANKFIIRNVTTATNILSISIDWDTGVITHLTGAGCTSVQMAGGWWRIILPALSGITSGDSVRFYTAFVGGSETAGEYCYLWGAQLEAGTFPTSYIPTTTASATRAIDNPFVTGLASVLSGDFTLYAEVDFDGTPIASGEAATFVGDASGVERLGTLQAQTSYRLQSATGGVTTTTGSILALGPTRFRSAVASLATQQRVSANGGAVVVSAANRPVGMDRIAFGLFWMNTLPVNGYVRKIVIYPRAFSDAELQAITA